VRIAAIVTTVAALTLAAGASAKQGGHVLALVWQDQTATIRLLDSTTLASRGGALPIVRTSAGPHAFSPNGRRLALQTRKHGVRILAVPSLRVLRTVRPAFVTYGLVWRSARRLLILEHGSVLVVDPVTGRVVMRRGWNADVLSWKPWNGGAVVLAARASGGIEPVRLLVVGRSLGIRQVGVGRISAGVDGGENNQGPWRTATPSLALDPAGGRAFVAGGALVATVDLRTLGIRYHGPERTPQKVFGGPQRVAAWLGNGTLAVSGADYVIEGDAQRMTPYGLRFVDVDTGETRLVDSRATDVATAGGLALVAGYDRTRQSPGMGVAAYDRTGAVVWRRYEGARLESPRVAAGHAYAYVGRNTWHVLDPATGRTRAARAGISLNLLG
jgi:hypothetical protein